MINYTYRTIYKYELRFNDGVINTHPDIIEQVALMQKKLKANHCFNDLLPNGKYDNITRNAVLLMKTRLRHEVNDKCDLRLWRYFLEEEDNIAMIAKPLQGLSLPENIKNLIALPTEQLENILAKLVCIPILKSLNSSQISVLMGLVFYLGFDYGLEEFSALNRVLSAGNIKNVPKVLKLYQTKQQKELIDYLCHLWMS